MLHVHPVAFYRAGGRQEASSVSLLDAAEQEFLSESVSARVHIYLEKIGR
jgi:hypothetical protein